jgi:hypothetical protein
MLDSSTVICYNGGINKPLENDYMMIELTMQRMSRIEDVLNNSRSEWARNHWSQVLKYFQRRLVEQGADK